MEKSVRSTRRWYRQGKPERCRRMRRLPDGFELYLSLFERTGFFLFYGKLEVELTKQVADSEFTYSSSFVIWIYHDGEFCTIEEAWEQGLLTKEQVALMAEYHEKATEYIREYYQAQLPE